MLEAKIVVYSKNSDIASACVLALISLIPGASWLGFQSHGFGSRFHAYDKYAFPLNLFHGRCAVYPYLSLQMMDSLSSMRGFLIGTTNKLFLHL